GNATLEFGVSASETWFSATPLTGVVEAGQTLDIEVSFTTTGLEVGNYNGSLTFTSNDLVTPTLVVPVSLTILVGLEENPMAAIAVYPVPAINQVNINLVEGVTSIRMFNSHSQVVLESIVNDELIKTLDLEGLRSGIYTLQFINAQGKTFNKSIIINR
ncbi:MAG: T9SS type A sorting domain-containing protein, partial [Ignavibacteria bacterium]|nr:T9SS type A sorting domain-containing protein [Ignavibacteria bacterium]